MPSKIRQKLDDKRKQKTRVKLLISALQVFSERGYHNTLISDIVQNAGLGQGTFYRYFTDKPDVFEALMEDFIDSLFDEFSDMSANLPSNQQEYFDSSLSALMRIAKIAESHQEIIRLFLKEAPSINNEFAEMIQLVYKRFAELAKYYLDHAINQGFARVCKSDVVAVAIVGVGVRLVETWSNEGFDKITLEEMIFEVVNFAFLGIGINPDNS